MLSVNNIEVVYNSVILVLRGVSFRVEPGQVVALLGSNGAGKSTTLKAISGLLRAEGGGRTRIARVSRRGPARSVPSGPRPVRVIEQPRRTNREKVPKKSRIGGRHGTC